MAGVCTVHDDCPPNSGSEDVNIDLLPRPIGQRVDKLTAPGRARISKLTVEGDCFVEEGNIGTLDITCHWQGGKGNKILSYLF